MTSESHRARRILPFNKRGMHSVAWQPACRCAVSGGPTAAAVVVHWVAILWTTRDVGTSGSGTAPTESHWKRPQGGTTAEELAGSGVVRLGLGHYCETTGSLGNVAPAGTEEAASGADGLAGPPDPCATLSLPPLQLPYFASLAILSVPMTVTSEHAVSRTVEKPWGQNFVSRVEIALRAHLSLSLSI